MRWLFIEGLTRESRHWEPFLPATKAFCEPGALHRLDLAGAGSEHRRPGFLDVAGYVDDLRLRWLRLAGSAEPWGLVSLSMGGMVGLDWTARYPGDFAAHVVMSCSVGSLSSPWRRARPGALGPLLRGAVRTDPLERELALLRTVTNTWPGLPAWSGRFAEYAQQAPVSLRNSLRQLVAVLRFRQGEAPRLPTLVLAGGRDRLVHPDCSYDIARWLGAPLRVHPTAGHGVHLDAPEWVAGAIAEWLRGLGLPRDERRSG